MSSRVRDDDGWRQVSQRVGVSVPKGEIPGLLRQGSVRGQDGKLLVLRRGRVAAYTGTALERDKEVAAWPEKERLRKKARSRGDFKVNVSDCLAAGVENEYGIGVNKEVAVHVVVL